MFHTYVVSVLSGYCVCLQWFLSVSEACFQLFHCLLLYVASVACGYFKSKLSEYSGSPFGRCRSDF
jgi:hypothetical protein